MFDFGLYTQVSDSGPHGPLVFQLVSCVLLGQSELNGFPFYSGISVMVFDTQVFSRCDNFVESSFLIHHRPYPICVCFPCCFIDGLGNLHADQKY